MSMTDNAAVVQDKFSKPRPRWQKYFWIVFGVVMIGAGLSKVWDGLHPGLAECQASDATTAVYGLIVQNHIKLKSIGNPKTLSRTGSVAQCSADVVASDNSKVKVFYRIDLNNGKNTVHIAGAKPA